MLKYTADLTYKKKNPEINDAAKGRAVIDKGGVYLLLQELKRAFSNKMFQIVLLISTLIPFMNTYVIWKSNQTDIAMSVKTHMEEWVFLSVFSGWIGSEFYTLGYSLFFFIFPLFVCAGYGWSFRRELDTGYINQIVSRVGKVKYYISKYFSIFITGGTIFVFPMLINFLVGMTYQNLARPDSLVLYFAGDYKSFLGDLFFSHPLLFCIIYLFVDFIFCGILACVCMSLSFFVRNKISVIVIPFLALLFWHEISGRYLTGDDTIYTTSLLRMVHPTGAEYLVPGNVYVAAIAVMFVLTFGITFYKATCGDVL